MAYKKLKQILLCGALSAALATAPVFASDGVSSAASDAVTTADTSEPAAESSVSTPKETSTATNTDPESSESPAKNAADGQGSLADRVNRKTESVASKAEKAEGVPAQASPAKQMIPETFADYGIEKVVIGYLFEDGSFDEWTSGSGFLINGSYALTDRECLTLGTDSEAYQDVIEEKTSGYAAIGIDLNDFDSVKDHLTPFMRTTNGTMIQLTYDPQATGAYAVLKLGTEITGQNFLPFAEKEPVAGEIDYVFGYTKKDQEMSLSGKELAVTSVVSKNGVTYVEYKGPADEGYRGAPLVNGNGEMIGIITDTKGTTVNAISAESIARVLNDAGILYTSASDVETRPAKTRSELTRILDEAQAKLDSGTYTSASAAALSGAIEDGKKVLEQENASETELTKAYYKVADAMDVLVEVEQEEKPKFHLSVPILVAIIAVLSIAALIIIIILKKNEYEDDDEEDEREAKRVRKENKKKEAEAKKKHAAKKKTPSKKKRRSRDEELDEDDLDRPVDRGDGYDDEEEDDDDGSGDTGILNKGAGETGVLNKNKYSAYLVHEVTNEEIPITKREFKIGKERRKVDYCIPNETISRIHCVIRTVGSDFYVEDKDSLNGTEIDGVHLTPFHETRIMDGSQLVLSDVEFTFHEK